MVLWDKKYRTILLVSVILLLFLITAAGLIFFKSKIMPSARGPNIILIVIDCLRADHVGYFGYTRNTTPYLDELAKSGVVFKNAYSNAPWTKPSVVSMLTSLLPNEHGAVNYNDALPDEYVTLGEIMGKLGYETLFFNGGNPWIKQKFNIPQGFQIQYHAISRAEELTDNFLSVIRETNKKFFAYLHYMDAHVPYHQNRYTLMYTTSNNDDFVPGSITYSKVEQSMRSGKLTAQAKEYLEALYDGQVRYVDMNIHRVMNFLKEQGLLDNTLIIITSDHGEEFWDHGNFEHGHSLYNELLKVPLIITGRNLTHKKIDDNIRLIDIAPTVVELAGQATTSYDFSGKSLMGLMEGKKEEEQRPVFAMGTFYNKEKFCYIDSGNLKVTLNTGVQTGKLNRLLPGNQEKPEKEFYNLDVDPLEEDSVLTDSEKLELEKKLEAQMRLPKKFDKKEVSIDPELEDKLRTLGYLQ